MNQLAAFSVESSSLLGVVLSSAMVYVPATLVARSLELAWMLRASQRRPAAIPFFGMHLGAALVSAIVSPALCYLAGGLMVGATGLEPGETTPLLWIVWWLISYAVPLQLHYTANSVLTRVGEECRIVPGWMPLVWAGVTAITVTVAWIPIWIE